MNDPVLLPCPFCNGSAKIVHVEGRGGHNDYPPSFRVQCANIACGIRGLGFDYYRGGEQSAKIQAAEQWNTRIAPPAARGEVAGS